MNNVFLEYGNYAILPFNGDLSSGELSYTTSIKDNFKVLSLNINSLTSINETVEVYNIYGNNGTFLEESTAINGNNTIIKFENIFVVDGMDNQLKIKITNTTGSGIVKGVLVIQFINK